MLKRAYLKQESDTLWSRTLHVRPRSLRYSRMPYGGATASISAYPGRHTMTRQAIMLSTTLLLLAANHSRQNGTGCNGTGARCTDLRCRENVNATHTVTVQRTLLPGTFLATVTGVSGGSPFPPLARAALLQVRVGGEKGNAMHKIASGTYWALSQKCNGSNIVFRWFSKRVNSFENVTKKKTCCNHILGDVLVETCFLLC